MQQFRLSKKNKPVLQTNKFMMKIFLPAFFSLLFCLSLQAQTKIMIAVASNMQYTVEAIKTEFQKTDKIQIDVVLGASGNLVQQILQGAPFDIFISADTVFPQKLFEKNFTVQPPKVYAQGVLVLWSVKQNILLNSNLQFLLFNNIKAVAIANPKTAPYGVAAEAILKKYNVYHQVKNKLATGQNVSQASQFIATGAADAGFTAKAIVLSGEMKGRGKWIELNRNDYPPIKQSAALLKYSQKSHSTEAKKFYDFLYSMQAKEIYKKFGYVIN